LDGDCNRWLRPLRRDDSLNEMISGLDLLFLEVNSLEESLVFYERVLGMEVESVNMKSEPPMARLRGGALRITLAQNLETMLRRGRGVHFFVGVEDVDQQTMLVFRSPGATGDEGHGHVGFFASEEDGRLQVLGGNQAGGQPGSTGGVKVATFARSSGSLEVHSIRSFESFRKPETT